MATRSKGKEAKLGARRGRTVDADVKAAAAKAKREARSRGAVGNVLTPAARRLRDAAILSALAAGDTQEQAAKAFGVSRRQVIRIVKDRREQDSGLDAQPMEFVEELLKRHHSRIAQLDAIAAENVNERPMVALSALRQAGEVQERLIALLEGLGKLPSNLELFRAQAELERISKQMMERLIAAVKGETTIEDVLEYVGGLFVNAYDADVPASDVHELPPG